MGSQLIDRQQSNSPQFQALSKRDKRRTLLATRLGEITKVFSENRDVNYRTQLQGLQIDMNLIMEAVPYDKNTLPDTREKIEALVQANMQKTMMKGHEPPLRAGKIFAEFAQEVNDAMEERDTALTTHMKEFETKRNTILTTLMYRKRLAENEHKSMAATIRDRLLNSVTAKKNRLSKDKDVLEIGEGNALLLHPSQYSVSNPGSPGGIHGKRATRHRRDPEELLNTTEPHRRKRKAHDSDESPAPKRLHTSSDWPAPSIASERHQPRLNGQQAKNDLINMQLNSPLYSVDKLFTEKEIAMNYHAAALAAHSYMVRQPNGTDDLESPPNESSETSGEIGRAVGDIEEPNAPSPPGMERQPSHRTRSTRDPFSSTYTGMNVEMVAGKHGLYTPPDIQMIARQIPKLPPLINIMGSRTFTRNDPTITLTGLTDQEAAAELELIKKARAYNDEHGYGRNLEVDQGALELLKHAASYDESGDKEKHGSGPYEHWLKSSAKRNQAATSSLRDELPEGQILGLGGVDMVKEGSFGGGSMGGTAMSRQATNESVKRKGRR